MQISNVRMASQALREQEQEARNTPRRIKRMIVKRETEKAYLVAQSGSTYEAWLPKSQMTDVKTREAEAKSGRMVTVISFTVPGWLAEDKML